MTGGALQIGSTIGDHQIVKKLGEGAMGAVYEGRHQLIGKRVAIKVLKGTGEDGRVAAMRLLEEARAVNAIDHKGIIDIFDAGVLPDGRPYLMMELLVGRTLHDEVKRAKAGLPLRLVFHVLRGVLDALVAAHRAGVIHRDLKASNVFLVDQPEGLPLVKLVDFGVARREGRQEALTMPSMTVGSMGFMAPEHIGGRPVPQSDLYACGCLAWLMLTGKPVFPYGNLPTLIKQHLEVMPPGVGTVRVETPPELEAFVAWLLEKRLEDRPHSAEVALTVLKEAEQSGDALRTVPGGPSFIELARKYDDRVRSQAGVKAAAPEPEAPPPDAPPHRSSPSRPPLPSEAAPQADRRSSPPRSPLAADGAPQADRRSSPSRPPASTEPPSGLAQRSSPSRPPAPHEGSSQRASASRPGDVAAQRTPRAEGVPQRSNAPRQPAAGEDLRANAGPADADRATRASPRSQAERPAISRAPVAGAGPVPKAEPPSAKQPRVLTAARRANESKAAPLRLDHPDEDTIPPEAGPAAEPVDFHDMGTVLDPRRRR
ncbi:MAG: protein kinase [Myxococcaceae bacterium]|nr:protein kinase [Myxococcaceae bacterium]